MWVPKANWPNVYFAIKRCKITITYDEWTDEHIVRFKDAPPRAVKFDDILPFLFEQFFNSFKFVPKEEQVKIALKISDQRPENCTNSLLNDYAEFAKFSSGDYDTDLRYLQDIGVRIWNCKDAPYEREVNRLDIKIDMEARKTSILNLLIQVENETDGSEGNFRWQPLTKVTKVKIRLGLSI